MINKNSLKNRWLFLTTTIITVTYIVFSSLLIYFMSVYLQELEFRSIERSLDEFETLFSTEPINTIQPSDIYSSLYDRQKMTLYTKNGENIITRTTGIDINIHPNVDEIRSNFIGNWEYENQSYLLGFRELNTPYFDGYLEVIHPLDAYNGVVRMMIIIATIIGFAFIIFTSIISYFFSIKMVQPLDIIRRQLKSVEKNGFSERLSPNTGAEETDYMVAAFNQMMDSLETSYNQQTQFVEDASHELRTPLQVVFGHLNLIKRWGRDKPEILDESLKISLDELRRINKLVEELLLLTKNNGEGFTEIEEVEINTEIQNRVQAFRKVHTEYKFELNLSETPIFYQINRHHFEQMLTIFLDNAIKYDDINKHIIITTSIEDKLATISIKDHGVGIPGDSIPSIFDRFYRVDKSRTRLKGGNGLGLSIAKKLIDTYKGEVSVDSVENEYTNVQIQFKL